MSDCDFFTMPKALFTSESVTEGHPDKICDQIADAILDAHLAGDPFSRVAVEAMAAAGVVVLAGEVTSCQDVDVRRVARDVVREIGYTDGDFGFDYRSCGILVSLQEQSPDIKCGVDRALEARMLELKDADQASLEEIGAGDQGIMMGFACNETPELMPVPIMLAHGLCHRLAEVRKDGTLPYLRPDGKSQVSVEYHYGKPVRVDTVVMAAQHNPDVEYGVLVGGITEQVIRQVIPGTMLDSRSTFYVNPTGRFVQGGPAADTGLTGRKIISDTYGGLARHGGGSFSGKDPTKVDRSGAYAARYVAKNVVAAGLADRCEVQIAYAIGVAKPVSILVETFGTGKVSGEAILDLIDLHFDLRPARIIQQLDLRRPIYRNLSVYGHFGRSPAVAPWEAVDKAAELRTAAGMGADIGQF